METLNRIGLVIMITFAIFIVAAFISFASYYGYRDIKDLIQCENAGYRYNYFHDCVGDDDKVIAPKHWRN